MSNRSRLAAASVLFSLSTIAVATTVSLPGQSFDVSFVGPAANAGFGHAAASLDFNGDGYPDLAIGTPGYDGVVTDGGRVQVYYGLAAGIDATPDWEYAVPQAGANFGTAVARAGDVNGDGYDDLIVGAPNYDTTATDTGGAFVFFGGAAPHTTPDQLIAVGQAATYLGGAVSGGFDLNGDGYADVAAGGIGFDNTGATNAGIVTVFFGAPGGVVSAGNLTSSTPAIRIGSGVALVGDVNGDGFADLAVGATDFGSGEVAEGAVFVYFGGAGTTFNTTIDATLQSNQTGAHLGSSVAAAGDVNGDGYADLLAGAPDFSNGQSGEGAAFLYLGGAGAFDTSADAQIEFDQAGATAGARVAGLGDVDGDGRADVAVAAPLFDTSLANAGRVAVYLGTAAGVAAAPTAVFSGTTLDGNLGTGLGSVDLGNDGIADLVAGAPFDDGASADLGAVRIARGAHSLPDNIPELTVEANNDFSSAGQALATGDLNGDGYVDLAVGAPGFDAPAAAAGRVTLHFGSATGLQPVAGSTLSTNEAGASFGAAVAIADVNGDGYADLVVGAPKASNGQSLEGRVYVYFGGAGAFDTVADAILERDQAGADFGSCVAAADVDGDGVADIAVGARFYDNGRTDEGALFVFQGGTSVHAVPLGLTSSGQSAGYLGGNCAAIGDVNGDGYVDLGAGAIGFDTNGASNGGRAVILLGGRPFDLGVDRILDGDESDGRFGTAIAGVGDTNGDGIDDFVVTAREYDNPTLDEGRAYLFRGGSSLPTTAHAVLDSNQASAFFGTAARGAGDVNHDGFADLWIGADQYDPAGSPANAGAALLFLGGAGNFDTTADRVLAPAVANGLFGSALAAGDFDGDGDPDLTVGAPGLDNPDPDEGGFLVYDGAGIGRPSSPQMYSAAPLAPVDPGNASRDGAGFTLAMEATSPRGRDRARLEIETCAAGVAFGSPTCVHALGTVWTDLGATAGGQTLAAQASGLGFGSLQHWRARVQYASPSVTQSGITAPRGPLVGPWRRVQATAGNADVRVLERLFADGFED